MSTQEGTVATSQPPPWCPLGYSHGQDGGHTVQGGDENARLTDEGREQQGPRGLPVGLAMAKHLQYAEREVGWIKCHLNVQDFQANLAFVTCPCAV